MSNTIVRETAYTELETSRFYCTLSLADYKRPNPFSAGQYVPVRVFKLPLPQELRDDTTVGYDNVNLKLVGDIINGNVGSGLAAEVMRQGGDVVSNLFSNIPAFGNAISTALPGDALGSALSQSIGVAPNPNPSVAFSGPILRDYTLTWTFMPNNAKEANAVRFIIQHLKMSSLPKNAITASAAILSYPRTCQLNFFPWDNGGGGRYGWSRRSIIRAKPAFMASVNVNYTSGVAPAFFHNEEKSPVITQLTINFKEIEYHLRHDWSSDGSKVLPPPLGDNVFEALGTILTRGRADYNVEDITTEAARTSGAVFETFGGLAPPEAEADQQ